MAYGRVELAASDIALEGRVDALRRSLPEDCCPEMDLDDDRLRVLGVDLTEPLLDGHSCGLAVVEFRARNLAHWVMWLQRTAEYLDADGNHAKAAEVRYLARRACRCIRLGRISADVLAREWEYGDGFQVETVPEYDQMCDEKRNVELVDAVGPLVPVERPRLTPTIRPAPDRRRSKGRPRPRGRRARRALTHAPPDDRLGRRPELAASRWRAVLR